MSEKETAFSSILFTLKKSEGVITKDDSEYYKYKMIVSWTSHEEVFHDLESLHGVT